MWMSETNQQLKLEKIWSYLALAIMTLCLGAVAFTFYLSPQAEGLIHVLLFGEGLLLCVILVLYVGQHLKIKEINAEKEDALSLLESRLAAIEAAADGIGIVNPSGNLLYMNSIWIQRR